MSKIIAKCEKLDRNKDLLIHVDDLEEVIQSCLPKNPLTRRELNHILSILTNDRRRGTVEYGRIYDVLDGRVVTEASHERWREGTPSTSLAMKTGSIGEFLEAIACPAETVNFKKLIGALERFERDTGMRISPTDDGLLIPLGPDLRASVKFYTN